MTPAAPSFEIELVKAGKRYNREWIFRQFSYTFKTGISYAITGNNGSGKSTLLQVIAGAILHSTGTINYNLENKPIEEPYSYIAYAAPYLELIEELTATEFFQFHTAFKKFSLPTDAILRAVQLENAADKQIRYYSSGMKQRLKLAQAFFSETPALFLDEPTTNLDEEGIQCYERLIRDHTADRLVIISSNDEREYTTCTARIDVSLYKV